MSDSPVPPDLDPVHGHSDDPLSADRRVLIIGAASMVVLILIGVVSAAVFTRSACGAIGPEPVLPRTSGAELAPVLAEGLPDLFDDERDALAQYLEVDLAGRLGPMVGAVDVTGADALAAGAEADAAPAVALGQTTTVFDPATGAVRETASVGEGTVVGGGTGLFSLALTNPGTGQVDAFIPLDLALEGGDCVDTATVATPFSFLLGADQGQLLLFRVEEDGEAPQVELREGTRGQLWATDLQTPQIPPGVSGERLDAAMGDELVVVGRRAERDDEPPAVSAFARDSGEQRWTIHLDDLETAAPAGDGPVWVEVLTVARDVVVLGLARDDDRRAANLVALETADGRRRWTADAEPLTPLAAHAGGDAVTVLGMTGDEVQSLRLDAQSGEVLGAASQPSGEPSAAAPDGGADGGPVGSIVGLGDGQVLATTGRGVMLIGPDEIAGVGFGPESAARIVDALALDGVTTLLVTSADGAVAVSFATP